MYKNTQHYRYTVHRYLDSIWKVSSRRGKARSTMYSWLSTQMDLPEEETHVAKFTRNQCKQAIKILKPKYIELFGKDLSYRKENKMANDPILIKELIEKLDTIPEDIIKKSIIETLKEDESIKIKLRNNILVEELNYFNIEDLVKIDNLNNKYILTNDLEVINKLLEAGLGVIVCK